MNFQKWISTANTFINEVAAELRMEGEPERVRRIVRVVLHALRARLSPEQSVHLLAQLPMLLKAVYVQGWRLNHSVDRGIRTEDDFLHEIFRDAGSFGPVDFPEREDARRAAVAVLRVMTHHVSAGQMNDVLHEMPRHIRPLIEEAMQEH